MSMDDPRLEDARARAAFARASLKASIGAVQARFEPARLANDAWSELRGRGAKVADDSVAFARAKPAVASVAVGAGVLLILRRPIARTLHRLFSRREAVTTDRPVSDGLD